MTHKYKYPVKFEVNERLYSGTYKEMSFLLSSFSKQGHTIPEVTENPLLFTPLPDNKEELDQLEQHIARKMSEANTRCSQASQQIMIFSQKRKTTAAAEQVSIRARASMELRLLSQRWMEIVKKQTDLLERSKQ